MAREQPFRFFFREETNQSFSCRKTHHLTMSAPKKASAKRSSAKKKKGDPNERVLTAAQEAKVRQAFKTHCEDPFSTLPGALRNFD